MYEVMYSINELNGWQEEIVSNEIVPIKEKFLFLQTVSSIY